MTDDAELLGRYAESHSEEAFTELVRRHLDVVYSAACRQTGDPHRAQDVVQTVFADLARKAPSLSRHTALVGWLYTSTHFAATKLRRTEQRRQAREQEAHAMQEILASPSGRYVDWERLRPVLDAAMHELNRRDRDAVLLRFFEQRTLADVGRALGLGENAARMRVERALEKLGGLLAKRGVTSTTAALSLVLANQAVAAVPATLVRAVATGALGQAAASSGLTLALQFMSTTKITVGATALAGLLAISAGVFYLAQTTRPGNELAATERTIATLQGRLRNLEGQAATPKSAAENASLTPPPIVAAAAPPESVADRIKRALVEDPELIRLRAREASAGMDRQLGGFYREANFSREQIGQFTERMNATFEQLLSAQAGGRFTGGEYSLDASVYQKLAEVRGEFERYIRGSFGETALRRFLDYERLESAREISAGIAAKVFFTETPLGATQSAELQRILANHSPSYAQGGNVSRLQLDWDHVLAEAAPLLSPVQFAALQAERARAESDAKVNEAAFPGVAPASP